MKVCTNALSCVTPCSIIPLWWWSSVIYLRRGNYLLSHCSTEFQKTASQVFKLHFFFTFAFYKIISYEEDECIDFFCCRQRIKTILYWWQMTSYLLTTDWIHIRKKRHKISYQFLKFFLIEGTVKKRIFSWSFNTHSVVHITLVWMEVKNKNKTCSLKCYDLIGFMLFTHIGLEEKEKNSTL